MKKKLLSIMLTTGIVLSSFVGCTSKTPDSTIPSPDSQTVDLSTATDINIACMKGPTGIGMIKLLDESDKGESFNHYNYSIVGTADEIATKLIKGELDIAAVPCNLASILYNKTKGEIVSVAINALGVLYMVENGTSVNDVKDLKGKTIYSTGQGTTPEYTLRFLLSSAGLDTDKDVNIEFKAEPPEVLAALNQNSDAIGMLPQPYVTVALNSNKDFRIALDITKEWEKHCEGTVVTGVVVARKSFIEENKKAFKQFLEEYEASTKYANENIEETAALLEKFDVFKAAIAKKALPMCNVTYIDGSEMKDMALTYLKVLYGQNPNAVGGKLEEGMFYIDSLQKNTN